MHPLYKEVLTWIPHWTILDTEKYLKIPYQERKQRMKLTALFLTVGISICLLAGCGGSDGGNGGNGTPAEPCETNEDCNDPEFCNGVETCVDGTCQAGTPPCDDGNACTDDECVEFGQRCKSTCNATGHTDACCSDTQCQDEVVCAGTPYDLNVTDLVQELNQEPSSCLISQAILNLVMPTITATVYAVTFPPKEAYPTTVDLEIPFPGTISVDARLEGDELVFDPVTIEVIDLSEDSFLRNLGLHCLVGGTADGSTDQFEEDLMTLNLNIYGISVSDSTTGECPLEQPDPACTLIVTSEGDKKE